MKLRVADRILVFTAGLLLLACCTGIVCQLFFGVNVIAFAERLFSSDSLRVRSILIGIAVLTLLLGCYCVLVLFRHRRRRDRFVFQKNENGDLAISIKALENMVQKCLDQHKEIDAQKLRLESRKDGLLISITGDVAGGISIPLTVEALQKQIRQYVTACSGVEIKGITVQIEGSGEDAPEAPFAIAAPSARPLLREAEENTAVQAHIPDNRNELISDEGSDVVEESAQETQKTQSPASVSEVVPEQDDQDDRPLHQRLFSAQPEPCIVPEPPVNQENQGLDHEDHEQVSEKECAEAEEFAEEMVSMQASEVPSESDAAEPDHMEENESNKEDVVPASDEISEPQLSGDSSFLESLKAFDHAIAGEETEEKDHE